MKGKKYESLNIQWSLTQNPNYLSSHKSTTINGGMGGFLGQKKLKGGGGGRGQKKSVKKKGPRWQGQNVMIQELTKGEHSESGGVHNKG